MTPVYLTQESIQNFILTALHEDIGNGDHTTLASIPSNVIGKAQLILKDEGILAGIEVALEIFRHVDRNIDIKTNKRDGDSFVKGEIALWVEGSVHSILKSERLVLNTMQRMSGIASYTHELQKSIAHTKTKVLDTRKTTPNFRMLEKWAVLIGGGVNHRYGLYDMILLKDNHIDYLGSVEQALRNAKEYIKNTGLKLDIEVEARTLMDVHAILKEGGAKRILLDNMSLEQLRSAVQIIGQQMEIEASGGIDEKTIIQVAETGVDYISLGALTHSYKSKDMSLKAF
jgi:nicotinate-nucleotide pyrophosphorylase (carboxylating)